MRGRSSFRRTLEEEEEEGERVDEEGGTSWEFEPVLEGDFREWEREEVEDDARGRWGGVGVVRGPKSSSASVDSSTSSGWGKVVKLNP